MTVCILNDDWEKPGNWKSECCLSIDFAVCSEKLSLHQIPGRMSWTGRGILLLLSLKLRIFFCIPLKCRGNMHFMFIDAWFTFLVEWSYNVFPSPSILEMSKDILVVFFSFDSSSFLSSADILYLSKCQEGSYFVWNRMPLNWYSMLIDRYLLSYQCWQPFNHDSFLWSNCFLWQK